MNTPASSGWYQKLTLIAITALLGTSTAHGAAGVVCPYTFLFTMNGQHYYSACQCDMPYCSEVAITQILIYNSAVPHLGCNTANPHGPNAKCICLTNRNPDGTIFNAGDLSAFYDASKPWFISNDQFVEVPAGEYKICFRTMTINSRLADGTTESRSLAIPMTAKIMERLSKEGLGGKPIEVKQSSFDGLNVVVAGKSFPSAVSFRAIGSVPLNAQRQTGTATSQLQQSQQR